MSAPDRVIKPATRRGKRVLKNRAPKLIENVKQTLFIYGKNNSLTVKNYMKYLYALKKTDAIRLNKKNDILPFEDVSPIEKLCQKYDTSLFVFSSHNKKKPNNIVIGRLFDGHLLDMFEFGLIEPSADLQFYPCVGRKPCLIFNGEDFEQIDYLNRFKNLLVDLFHGDLVTKTELSALEYVMSFTFGGDKILLRTYRIVLDTTSVTGGNRGSPRVILEAMGPNADLILRRRIMASDDLFSRACRKPKLVGKKIKNIRRDVFGSKLGRVHMTSQSIDKLQTRKLKGLRKPENKLKRKSNEKNTVDETHSKMSKLSIE